MSRDELTNITNAIESILEMVVKMNFDMRHLDVKRADDARAAVAKLRGIISTVESKPVEPQTIHVPKTEADGGDDYIDRIARTLEARWREQGIIR